MFTGVDQFPAMVEEEEEEEEDTIEKLSFLNIQDSFENQVDLRHLLLLHVYYQFLTIIINLGLLLRYPPPELHRKHQMSNVM